MRIAAELSITPSLAPLSLRSFAGQPLAACYCNTIRDSQILAEKLAQADMLILEADIRLADRFLMERFIQGSIEFTGQITDFGHYRQVQQAKCRQGDYLPTLNMVSLDIECSEKGLLYSIGLDSPMDSRVIMIGQPEPAETPIQWVEDEYQLLKALIAWFEQFDPDVIIGWSVVDFDFRLLHKRAEFHKLKLTIGRAQQPSFFRTASQTQQGFISIPGRVVLDGIDTLKPRLIIFVHGLWSRSRKSCSAKGKRFITCMIGWMKLTRCFATISPHSLVTTCKTAY